MCKFPSCQTQECSICDMYAYILHKRYILYIYIYINEITEMMEKRPKYDLSQSKGARGRHVAHGYCICYPRALAEPKQG